MTVPPGKPRGRSDADHALICKLCDTVQALKLQQAGPDPDRFVSLAVAVDQQTGENRLYAVDAKGGVWRYCPEVRVGDRPKRFAFWTKLTSHRADPRESPSTRKPT